MNTKIKNNKDLKKEKEYLKVKEQLLLSELNQQVESIGFFVLKNTASSLFDFFRKSK